MKLFMKNHFTIFVFLLLLGSVQAQTPKSNVANPDIEIKTVPYVFKSTSLRGRVEEAIEQGRESYIEPIIVLMRIYKSNPDKVLELLKPYVEDPNGDVKFTIIEAASFAPHSPAAMELLTAIVPSESYGAAAIDVFFRNYTRSQIVMEGGTPLKRALIRGAIRSRYTTNGYLLLSCFKNEPTILSFLERRRKTFPMSPNAVKKGQGGEAPRDTSSEVVTLDLALVELGRADALKRVKRLFTQKQTDELLDLLRYLKYVENKTVLSQTVELLKNKEQAEVVRTSHDNSILDYSRVCDEALVALYKRAKLPLTKKNQNFDYIAPRFSDQELTQAYKRLNAVFAAMKPSAA